MTQEITLLINDRWIPNRQPTVESFAAGIVDSEIAWMVVNAYEMSELQRNWDQLADLASCKPAAEADGILVHYPCDLVQQNTAQLQHDFEDTGLSQSPTGNEVQCLGNLIDTYVSELAVIDPCVVIDARSGPMCRVG